MPRTARIAPGGIVFHALNRANARARIFDDDTDFQLFERAMVDTVERVPMRILAYCLMPDHWHLVLWPHEDGALGAFMQRLTTTHVRRWHLRRESVGGGHLYQGTYKSFPVQQDEHFLTVCRYVEGNALRSGLAKRAEDWRWGSAWLRLSRECPQGAPVLSDWPVDRPRNWVSMVNRPQAQDELEALKISIQRGRPLGGKLWQQRTAESLNLGSTLRSRGRPRKNE